MRQLPSGLSPLPKQKLSHTSRDIKYIFLKGCKNISASLTLDGASAHKAYRGSVSCHPKEKHKPSIAADCCPPPPKYLPTSFTFPMHLEKHDMDSFPASRKRLPVFRQLCGEAVPGMAFGDVHPQNSSQELKEQPGGQSTEGGCKRLDDEAGSKVLPSQQGMD